MERKTKTNITHSLPWVGRVRAGGKGIIFIITGLLCLAFSVPAAASYIPFNTSVSMNVGIGTSTPQGALVVTNGNVGIGTWSPAGGLDVESSGTSNFKSNVGIGSGSPGQALDIQGTARMTGFFLNNSPAAGDILVSTSLGVGTWMPASTLGSTGTGTVNSGTVNRLAVYATTGTAVSDQTIIYEDGTNLGIGTAGPSSLLDVNRKFNVLSGGNVGIGTASPTGALEVEGGNVGIGTWAILTTLDVQGTARFGTSKGVSIGGGPTIVFNGYGTTYDRGTSGSHGGAISVTDSTGDMSFKYTNNTGSAGQTMSFATGMTMLGASGNLGINSVHPGQALDVQGTIRALGEITSGNVGIGTSFINGTGEGALTVMNGNVGIGTWTPSGLLEVGVQKFDILSGGNVGIGSALPGQILDVQGTGRMTGFILNSNPVAGDILMSDSVGVGSWIPASAIASAVTPSGWTVSGSNVYEASGGNVGIGTSSVIQGALVVTNGNVGIGTWTPSALLDVQGTANHFYVAQNGNVGIGTISPQAAFAIGNGTSNSWSTGGVLFVSSQVSIAGNPVVNGGGLTFATGATTVTYINNSTTSPGTFYGGSKNAASLTTISSVNSAITGNGDAIQMVVGNVGIGTITALQIYSGGNVGIGTIANSGNLGVGSFAPGQKLDVQGTIRDIGEVVNGNVGIGTSSLQTAFTVMNGNVGIGTWTAVGGNLIVNGGGNVGIGSAWPGVTLDVNGKLRSNALVPGEETVANATSLTPSGSFSITYQANTQAGGTLTINNPTNTPAEGQSWMLKISSTNAQTLSWGTVYDGGALGLPTATTGGGKTDKITFQYDTANGKFEYTGAAYGY